MRLIQRLQSIGLALAGAAGARLGYCLGYAICGSTLLNQLQRLPLPDLTTPKVLGVDDFAFRKGHHYGTILVNLETHQPIALLSDRKAKTLVEWLQAHPGIEVLSRDRSKTYKSAMTEGAPGAIQVADRFHLVKNLSETLEQAFGSYCSELKAAEQSQHQATIADAPEATVLAVPQPTKGHKSTRGDPELHDELKKRVNEKLTPKAVERLDILAATRGLSRSELIEKIAREEIPLGDPLSLGSRKLDESVYLFIEKAVQSMPPLDIIKASKIHVLPFAERESLPNSPGAFIVSDWVHDYYNTDMDLKRLFQENTFVKYMEIQFECSPEDLFVVWLTCDARLLKLVWSDIKDAFEAIREEVLLRSLLQERFQNHKRVPSKSEDSPHESHKEPT